MCLLMFHPGFFVLYSINQFEQSKDSEFKQHRRVGIPHKQTERILVGNITFDCSCTARAVTGNGDGFGREMENVRMTPAATTEGVANVPTEKVLPRRYLPCSDCSLDVSGITADSF